MLEFCAVHQKLPKSIFIASFVSFICLNLIENLIHFNAGKYHDSDEIMHFTLPSKKDFIKIIIIMLIFAALQGTFTLILSRLP